MENDIRIKKGDHVCSIYQNEDQQFSGSLEYLKEGFKSNEKCVYILDGSINDDFVARLTKREPAFQKFMDSGQFLLIPKQEAYLAGDGFSPDEMMSMLEKTESAALEEGYAGLRIIGEMTWVFDSQRYEEKLVEYENKLNGFFPESNSSAICQYDETKFDKRLLTDVVRSHPVLIIYGKIYENKYFYNPSLFYNTESASILSNEYETIIRTIIEDSD